MKCFLAILILSVMVALSQPSTLYVCLDYPYKNSVVFEYWCSVDSKAPIPGFFMQGTNGLILSSTPWETSTNWFLVARTPAKWIAVKNNGSNALFVARAVDTNSGLASKLANSFP